jgi:hypothetical protein
MISVLRPTLGIPPADGRGALELGLAYAHHVVRHPVRLALERAVGRIHVKGASLQKAGHAGTRQLYRARGPALTPGLLAGLVPLADFEPEAHGTAILTIHRLL